MGKLKKCALIAAAAVILPVAAGAAQAGASGSAADRAGYVWLFAALVIIAMTAFISYERVKNKRLKRAAEIAKLGEERYRFVVAESGREVFQYDVAAKSVHRDNILYDYFGEVKDIKNWLAFFENSHASDPEGVSIMREMFARIDAGESAVTFDVSLAHPNGKRDWNRFHANTIFALDGRPVAAVVSYFACTDLHEREAAYHKWLNEDKRLEKEFMARFNWNVSKDAVEDAHCDGCAALACEGGGIEKWAADYASAHVHKDDVQAYLRVFETERLLGAFEHGLDAEKLDYRETGKDGYRWIRLIVQLTKHPQSGDVKARLLYQDVDGQKRAELEMIARSELDSLTGALNRETLAKRITRLIEQSPSSSHAVLMMDIDGFKAVNDILGHDAGDEALKRIVAAVRGCLRSGDLVGRLGGDEILVVLRDIPSDAITRKKARQLCSALNMRVGDGVDISVSIGIALYPRDGGNYEELYKRADEAMYRTKSTGKNGFFFYSQFALQSREEAEDAAVERMVGFDARAVYAGDSAENARLFEFALAGAADARSFTDVRQALVAMRRDANGRNLALIDFESPERTAQAVSHVAADCVIKRTALIAAVDPDDADAVARVMSLGATDYIVRPFDSDELSRRARAGIIRLKREAAALSARRVLDESEGGDSEALMRATGSVMTVCDLSSGAFIYNPSIERMLAGNYDSRPLWRIFASDMVARSADVKRMRDMVECLTRCEEPARDEMRVTLKAASGERRVFRFQAIRPPCGNGVQDRMLLVFTDINDAVEKSEKLVFKAERDQLTGLYNAGAFFEKARELISAREEGFFTIMAIDMDNFKSINNQFGRTEGDRLLCSLSERLCRAAHTGGGLVGRIASDNFVVLCGTQSVSSFENAINDQSRVPELYRDYVAFAVHAGRYTVSDRDMSVNDMYDRAMIAKSSIKYRYDAHFADFSESMLELLVKEQSIVSVMDAALSENQFEVWYQPQYSILTNSIVGAEALVRWRRPNFGVVPPAEYIPLFESNGFIYKLDRFVWRSVAKSLADRLSKGLAVVPVSVNVSRFDIYQPDFYETVTAIPEKYGISVKLIRLEITESAISSLSKEIIELIERLRAFGFEILIDDFGSGYSSLGVLKDMQSDAIKLDGSLLRSVDSSQRADKIVRSVMDMARLLDVPVIAEGVERSEQAEYLKDLGCLFAQGYVYSRPVPESDFECLMDAGNAVEQ